LAHGRSITITGKDRPELFRATLLSLVDNDLAGWLIVIRVEPGPRAAEFEPIAAEILAGRNYNLKVNERVLGIRLNPFSAIEAAFAAGSTLNLCLEEDMRIAPDATALALWYEAHHRPEWLCLSLLAGPCGSTALLSNPNYSDLLFTAKTCNSIGVAIRREEWTTHVRAVWNGERRLPWRKGALAWRYNWGWDWSLYALIAASPILVAVQPVLARATHTGRIGTYALPAFHDLAFGRLAINKNPEVDYRLVAAEDLPPEVHAHVRAHRELTDMLLTIEELGRGRSSRSIDRAWHRGERIWRG
jgi:hypothetical protein